MFLCRAISCNAGVSFIPRREGAPSSSTMVPCMSMRQTDEGNITEARTEDVVHDACDVTAVTMSGLPATGTREKPTGVFALLHSANLPGVSHFLFANVPARSGVFFYSSLLHVTFALYIYILVLLFR